MESPGFEPSAEGYPVGLFPRTSPRAVPSRMASPLALPLWALVALPLLLLPPRSGGPMEGSPKPSAPAAKIRPPRVLALDRERLMGPMAWPFVYRLGVVVAPAGSGKTTFLAQFAANAPGPVAWLWAEPHDGRERDF